jgi:hypothetical protein
VRDERGAVACPANAVEHHRAEDQHDAAAETMAASPGRDDLLSGVVRRAVDLPPRRRR